MAVVAAFHSESWEARVWHISESVDELKSMTSHRWDNDPMFLSFSNDHRQCEWLSVRCLLIDMLGHDDNIVYCDGKPSLLSSSRHISIAHTTDHAILVVSDISHPVTADIESKTERAYRIHKAFLDDMELSFLHSASDFSVAEYSCCIWCAKEAIYKLMDSGCYSFKNDCHCTSPMRVPLTRSSVPYIYGRFSAFETCSSSSQRFLVHYFLLWGKITLAFAEQLQQPSEHIKIDFLHL